MNKSLSYAMEQAGWKAPEVRGGRQLGYPIVASGRALAHTPRKGVVITPREKVRGASIQALKVALARQRARGQQSIRGKRRKAA